MRVIEWQVNASRPYCQRNKITDECARRRPEIRLSVDGEGRAFWVPRRYDRVVPNGTLVVRLLVDNAVSARPSTVRNVKSKNKKKNTSICARRALRENRVVGNFYPRKSFVVTLLGCEKRQEKKRNEYTEITRRNEGPVHSLHVVSSLRVPPEASEDFVGRYRKKKQHAYTCTRNAQKEYYIIYFVFFFVIPFWDSITGRRQRVLLNPVSSRVCNNNGLAPCGGRPPSSSSFQQFVATTFLFSTTNTLPENVLFDNVSVFPFFFFFHYRIVVNSFERRESIVFVTCAASRQFVYTKSLLERESRIRSDSFDNGLCDSVVFYCSVDSFGIQLVRFVTSRKQTHFTVQQRQQKKKTPFANTRLLCRSDGIQML